MTHGEEPAAAAVGAPVSGEGSTAVPPAARRRSWFDALHPAPGEPAAAVRVALLLLVAGLPLGVLWWLLAPRREYEVSADGAFAVAPESEAAVGSDGWFMLLTGGLALVAALLVWRQSRRGPLMVVGLAGGMLLCGLLAWQVGALLAPRPSAAELADIGTTVLGPLGLRAYGVLVVAPFLAVAGYLLAVCFTPYDDLRPGGRHGRHRIEVAEPPPSVG